MSWTPDSEVDEFVRDLRNAFGQDLTSVVLHGSVVRGEAHRDVSDINLLVLVEDVSPGGLTRGATLARRWHEAGHGLPLVFTAAEWARALDVFPVEIADMGDHRRVVHGADPVDARVSLRHLRLQAEREIRGRLVHLREGMLLAADRPEELGRLLLGAAPSVAAYLRALLRLRRTDVPASTPDVVDTAGRILGVDTSAFQAVWKARRAPGSLHPTLAQTAGVFDLLLATADHVDTLEDR